MDDCSHEWAITDTVDGVSWGHCQKCPAKRGFPATMLSGERKQQGINLGGRGPGRPKKVKAEETVAAMPVTDDGAPEPTVPPRPAHKGDKSRYYEKHKEELIRDAETLGVVAMQRKWDMPQSSWTTLRRRWGLPKYRPGRKGRQVVVEPEPTPKVDGLEDHVVLETTQDWANYLAGYRLAVRDITGGKNHLL